VPVFILQSLSLPVAFCQMNLPNRVTWNLAILGKPETSMTCGQTVLEWFADHNPFDVSDSRLRSIATGVGADVQSSNVRAVRNSTDNTAADQLLAVHAISGCDTTSALFGHGKAGVYRKVVENPDTKPFTDVLSSVDASQTAVVEAITI